MRSEQPCVAGPTLDDLQRRAVVMVLEHGAANAAHRGATSEVIGARLELLDPRSRVSRTETRRKIVSALAELCWYLRGTNAADPITFWVPRYRAEVEDNGIVHGGYGPRLLGEGPEAQLSRVIQMLSDEGTHSTRRAVVQLFDRRDIAAPVRFKDVPCTCTMQFLRRPDGLHLVVSMRSSDALVGLTHDVFCFTMLQEIVANELGVDLGTYVHLAGSLHIYDENRADAQTFLDEGWQSTTDPMPSMPSGAQWPHIAELLGCEERLREGRSYAELELPGDPYWADLVRVLALHVARVKRPDEPEAQRIVNDLQHPVFSEFV